MMNQQLLQNAVDSKMVPVYMTSYTQIKDYLQDKHGAKGWIGAMAQAVTGSEKRSGKGYRAARRSIERFETGQQKSTGYAKKMPDVGKTLPPIGKKLPGNSITVTVKGKQYEGSKGGRDREFTATFTGADAIEFTNNPTYKDFFKRLGYPDWVIKGFDGGDSSGLDVYEVTAA